MIDLPLVACREFVRMVRFTCAAAACRCSLRRLQEVRANGKVYVHCRGKLLFTSPSLHYCKRTEDSAGLSQRPSTENAKMPHVRFLFSSCSLHSVFSSCFPIRKYLLFLFCLSLYILINYGLLMIPCFDLIN